MLKIHKIILVAGLMFFLPACSERRADIVTPSNRNNPDLSVHAGASGKGVTAEIAVTEAVKKQFLPGFPEVPIGKALESYSHLAGNEWKVVRTDAGKFYIDYIGWLDSKGIDINSLKDGVSRRGVDLKFVVAQDGAFGLAMVSRLEAKTDGMVASYPLDNPRPVLEMIYSNKEIRF